MRAIVEELNGALLPHGWQIVPLGWEQRGPAAGRAQADINVDARTCDVFLVEHQATFAVLTRRRSCGSSAWQLRQAI